MVAVGEPVAYFCCTPELFMMDMSEVPPLLSWLSEIIYVVPEFSVT